MKIKSVKASNFLSFKEVSYAIEPGKTIILGSNPNSPSTRSNGSGKSALLDVIPWCLFKECRSSNPSHYGKGDCSASVEFESNGNLYRVDRYYKHKEEKNNVYLFQNGEDISDRLPTQTDEKIRQVLSVTYDLFASCIIVTQGLPKSFSSLTPTLKKAMLEELVGVTLWDAYKQKAQTFLKDSEKTVSNYQSDLQTLSERYARLEGTVESYTAAIEEASKSDKERLTAIRQQIQEQKEKIAKLDASSMELVGNLDKKIRDFRFKIDVFQSKIREKDKILTDGVCPTCERPWDGKYLSSLESEKEDLEAQSLKLKKRLEEVLEPKAEEARNSLQEYREEERALSILKSQLQEELNKKASSDIKERLDAAIKEQEEIVTDRDKILEEVQEYISVRDNYSFILELLKPSSKFRSSVIAKYISNINSIIETITATLFSDIKLSLTELKAGIDFVITREGKKIKYREMSGGERRRIDIIMLLSFQKYLLQSSGVSTNIISLDEVFDGLDAVGVERVLACVDMLFAESESLYIVSHLSELANTFDNKILVEKINGISYIKS